ncbi:hypothetical protein U1Q18_000909 [Sarracenia purpurea var. burkii]
MRTTSSSLLDGCLTNSTINKIVTGCKNAIYTVRTILGMRDDEFDLDLEDIMVMEAIWLSIQENGRLGNPIYRYSVPSEQYMTEDHCVSAALTPLAEPSLLPSGGFASTIAALAEHQQTGRESSIDYEANVSTFNMQVVESSIAVSHDSQLTMSRNDGEWDDEIDHECQVAEVGTESWEF